MSKGLPKEGFPTVWESRSQGLGVPTLHYHFLTLFLGDHSSSTFQYRGFFVYKLPLFHSAGPVPIPVVTLSDW